MIQRKDLVDNLKFHLSIGHITDPTLNSITDIEYETILKQKTLSLGLFYPEIPLDREYEVMLLSRKEIYWKMALVSAPLYEMSMGDLKVRKQVRFDHYMSLILKIEEEYNTFKNDPTRIKVTVGETLVNTVYNQHKLINNYNLPKVLLNVDKCVQDVAFIKVDYIQLNPKDFVRLSIYTSDEHIWDEYEEVEFNPKNATHCLEIRDIHKTKFKVYNPGKYIAVCLKLANGLESYTELELIPSIEIIPPKEPRELNEEYPPSQEEPKLNTLVVTELNSLDRDLREIYAEFGTNAIQFLQHQSLGEKDIYGECEESFSEPFNLIGRLTVETEAQTQTGGGQSKDNTLYTFQIVKSVLDEHNVDKITDRDKIIYLGVELDIIKVTPLNVLGDYILQYEIIARGEEYISPIPNNNKKGILHYE